MVVEIYPNIAMANFYKKRYGRSDKYLTIDEASYKLRGCKITEIKLHSILRNPKYEHEVNIMKMNAMICVAEITWIFDEPRHAKSVDKE